MVAGVVCLCHKYSHHTLLTVAVWWAKRADPGESTFRLWRVSDGPITAAALNQASESGKIDRSQTNNTNLRNVLFPRSDLGIAFQYGFAGFQGRHADRRGASG